MYSGISEFDCVSTSQRVRSWSYTKHKTKATEMLFKEYSHQYKGLLLYLSSPQECYRKISKAHEIKHQRSLIIFPLGTANLYGEEVLSEAKELLLSLTSPNKRMYSYGL